MPQKVKRLSIIRKLISTEFISSQDMLIERLGECGVQITQSTLSRDLKFMHVAKVPHKEKGYIYVLPNSTHEDLSISTNISDNITNIAFSANMCVITTKPGYASAISVIIDSRKSKSILGTVAGDSNIILILHEEATHEDVFAQMQQLFPSLTHM